MQFLLHYGCRIPATQFLLHYGYRIPVMQFLLRYMVVEYLLCNSYYTMALDYLLCNSCYTMVVEYLPCNSSYTMVLKYLPCNSCYTMLKTLLPQTLLWQPLLSQMLLSLTLLPQIRLHRILPPLTILFAIVILRRDFYKRYHCTPLLRKFWHTWSGRAVFIWMINSCSSFERQVRAAHLKDDGYRTTGAQLHAPHKAHPRELCCTNRLSINWVGEGWISANVTIYSSG